MYDPSKIIQKKDDKDRIWHYRVMRRNHLTKCYMLDIDSFEVLYHGDDIIPVLHNELTVMDWVPKHPDQWRNFFHEINYRWWYSKRDQQKRTVRWMTDPRFKGLQYLTALPPGPEEPEFLCTSSLCFERPKWVTRSTAQYLDWLNEMSDRAMTLYLWNKGVE